MPVLLNGIDYYQFLYNLCAITNNTNYLFVMNYFKNLFANIQRVTNKPPFPVQKQIMLRGPLDYLLFILS